MLSALIPSEHSYPALHLVAKPVDQRFVQKSPLVLIPTPLKRLRLQQIETDLSHACLLRKPQTHADLTRNHAEITKRFPLLLEGLDYTTVLATRT